jgi:phospholipase/carboxylesterase
MLDSVIKQTAESPDASVIWMHGLGADGNAFADIIPKLKLPQSAPIRFVFPHAPERPISVHNGKKMRAWCDVFDKNLENNPDIASIKESYKLIAELIDAEILKGINSERILLIGFSQGAAMALHAAFHYPKKLAGAASLSSFFPSAATMPKNSANAKIPIFFGHGNSDPVVPPALSQKSVDFLKSSGIPVEWHTYNIKHSICIEELKELGVWIAERLRGSA